MNENLKIVIAVSGAFIISLIALSIFLGLYESGILYESEWSEKFELFDIFKTEGKILNPKHVSIEFLQKIGDG